MMKPCRWIALGLSAMLLCSGCDIPFEKKEIAEMNKKAITALNRGDYEDARDCFDRALDMGTHREEAEDLYEILTDYLNAFDAYKAADFTKAKMILDDLDDEYRDYDRLRKDVRNLKEAVESELKKQNQKPADDAQAAARDAEKAAKDAEKAAKDAENAKDAANASSGTSRSATSSGVRFEAPPAKVGAEFPIFHYINASATRADEIEGGIAYSYDAHKALDGDYDTCWGISDDQGLQPSLTLSDDQPQKLSGIKFSNGFFLSEETYTKNRRITKVRVSYAGGSVDYTCGIDQYGLMQDVRLPAPVYTDFVTLQVLSTYDGEWHDICISEFWVY